MSKTAKAKDKPAPRLGFILGDQLDIAYPEHMGLDPDRDILLMVEVAEESKKPASHFHRTVAFLSAMRHHRDALRDKGWTVRYIELPDADNTHTFAGELKRAIDALSPAEIHCIEPGDHRVRTELEDACDEASVKLTVHDDPHFLCSLEEFADWADGRKSLTLEYFYREQRKKLGALMTRSGKPEGGEWNYDKDNRKTFKAHPDLPEPTSYSVDDITEQVMRDVEKHLPDLPGSREGFNIPVTRRQALAGLRAFIDKRLAKFGDYQDAMWASERTIYHALLSVPINLKLLNPREVYQAAIEAYESGDAPLNAVEGFVRQIIGWREFIRGVYYYEGPNYTQRNGLRQYGSLPEFYWTGETDMACMKDCIASVLETAYGHHIPRLMVTGNFALISGVHPGEVNDWYLGMYADGVAWVTAPNTIGMAMHADGGVVGTKPYAASGKYINRMSNYCKQCRYNVNERTGEDACPFNTFYWDFLIRNEKQFKGNNRMTMILKNLERMSSDERTQITVSARKRRKEFAIGSISAP